MIGSLVLSVLCQSDLCARFSVLVLSHLCAFASGVCVCMCMRCCGDRRSLERGTKMPIAAQLETTAPQTSSRPHYLADECIRAKDAHQSVTQCSQGPITRPHIPGQQWNLQATHGASLTGLHTLISRGRNDI